MLLIIIDINTFRVLLVVFMIFHLSESCQCFDLTWFSHLHVLQNTSFFLGLEKIQLFIINSVRQEKCKQICNGKVLYNEYDLSPRFIRRRHYGNSRYLRFWLRESSVVFFGLNFFLIACAFSLTA